MQDDEWQKALKEADKELAPCPFSSRQECLIAAIILGASQYTCDGSLPPPRGVFTWHDDGPVSIALGHDYAKMEHLLKLLPEKGKEVERTTLTLFGPLFLHQQRAPENDLQPPLICDLDKKCSQLVRLGTCIWDRQRDNVGRLVIPLLMTACSWLIHATGGLIVRDGKPLVPVARPAPVVQRANLFWFVSLVKAVTAAFSAEPLTAKSAFDVSTWS